MFLDASAIVAVLRGEPEASGFLAAIEATAQAGKKTFTSPIERFGAVTSVAQRLSELRGGRHVGQADHDQAEDLVGELLREIGVRDIQISEGIGKAAREAALKYGEQSGHPAQLTMAECLSYACAKGYHMPLLSARKKFKETDAR